MHYYKLQMNVEGCGHPDWQTIGELEMIHPIETPSEARFWVSDATPDNKKLIEQTDGPWTKIKGGFAHNHFDINGHTIQFQLLKDSE
jgi:hypothetical protein